MSNGDYVYDQNDVSLSIAIAGVPNSAGKIVYSSDDENHFTALLKLMISQTAQILETWFRQNLELKNFFFFLQPQIFRNYL